MTLLHLAGFVGLWMTLRKLQENYPTENLRPGRLNWSLAPSEICITWNGEDFEVLDWLLNRAFQVDNKGLIVLTGLYSDQMSIEAQLARHQCLTRTFLQHNKSISSDGQGSEFIRLSGRDVEVKYKKVKRYGHQDFAKKLCDEKGMLRTEPIGIVSWLYPGLTVRHYAFKEHTKFEEPVELIFVLLFAIVACKYFILLNSAEGSKRQYALVIPEFTDLEGYLGNQKQAEKLSYGDFFAFGLGDAGLKSITCQPGKEFSEELQPYRGQVILFNQAPWSLQQNTRSIILHLCIREETLSPYSVFREFDLQTMVWNCTSQRSKLAYSFAGKIITENLANNQPWWSSFSEYSQNEEFFQLILDARKVLLYMLRKTKHDSRAEELFIQACHETFRRIYAKIYDRTQDGEFAQIERKNQQLRYRLRLCKNEDAFRGFLTGFLAEAVPNSVVVNNQTELMPILTGQIDWKLTRDLFLLSMVSYKKVGNLAEESVSQKGE
ncbi:MAG: type I-MYXAN CRISPR-associated Cas8a1/Cmx1 [Tildeniella nuda ZEHNDER 1965/U140]|jgi:CRISPR-associated protein Cas8a1/Csx13|nr:type I-MYXAN CRISPR-associated Cas8a1/Cmx1 [Tildeniella nuda ZEHNDER 1965/U140]